MENTWENVGRFTKIGVESGECVRKGCCKKGKHGQDYWTPLEGSRSVVLWKRGIPRGVGVVMPYSLPPSRVRYMSRLWSLTEEAQSCASWLLPHFCVVGNFLLFPTAYM